MLHHLIRKQMLVPVSSPSLFVVHTDQERGGENRDNVHERFRSSSQPARLAREQRTEGEDSS